tara:strand:- start:4069 stop:4629 length:561 start_codon:yes stop_codon:yes gene_type:complete
VAKKRVTRTLNNQPTGLLNNQLDNSLLNTNPNVNADANVSLFNNSNTNMNANNTTPVNTSDRNRRIGLMLAALSDAFAGRDIVGRALTRQQAMLPKQATVKELLDGIYNKIQRGEELTPQDRAVLDTYSKTSFEERILRRLGGDYTEESQDNVETEVTQGPKAIGTLPTGQTVVQMSDGSLKVLEN